MRLAGLKEYIHSWQFLCAGAFTAFGGCPVQGGGTANAERLGGESGLGSSGPAKV